MKKRARYVGLDLPGTPGRNNAITDVPGVTVGYRTLIEGDGALEATEEATINALLAAEDMTTLKPAGKVCRAIDDDALLEIMARYGRFTEEDAR